MKQKRSHSSDVIHRFLKNKLAVAGLIVIVLFVLLAIFAPYIAPYSYETQDYSAVLKGSSREHLLGTDNLGRDILSRLLYGTRYSLSMGVLVVVISAILGTVVGCISGYFGGTVDNLIMRFLDIYQSIPNMILAIALAAVLGPGMRSTVVALGIAWMPQSARLMRASILQIRGSEYIEAARVINASGFRVVMKHLLPNTLSPMIVNISMNIGFAILTAAGLSFIGLGVQVPLPEWGAMLSAGRTLMRDHPTLVIYPGLMIMMSVLAFNLFGDGLRDALDPRLKN